MIVYKITDKNMISYCDRESIKWKVGVPYEIKVFNDSELYRWIYTYKQSLLAVLCDPIFANYKKEYRLFKAKAEGKIKKENHVQFKCTKLTLLKEIDIPKITGKQRVAYSILCAKSILKDLKWTTWANNWLSGKDQSKKSAQNILKYIKATYKIYPISRNTPYVTVYPAPGVFDLAYAVAYASYHYGFGELANTIACAISSSTAETASTVLYAAAYAAAHVNSTLMPYAVAFTVLCAVAYSGISNTNCRFDLAKLVKKVQICRGLTV
jgi:hypothetical protein